jgi:hypothetical protein
MMIPDNGGYATAAYIAAAVVYVTYAFTLRARMRRLVARSESLAEPQGGRR